MGSVSSNAQDEKMAAGSKSHPVALEVDVLAMGARPGDTAEKRELFNEATQTVLVFENGAVIRLSAAVAIGQLLFLTHKESGREIVTQVLKKRSFRPTSCYVELEFTEPAPGFWGVDFPADDAAPELSAASHSVAEEVALEEIAGDDEPVKAAAPDAGEIARLRDEVAALQAQLKNLAQPAPAAIEPPKPPAPETAAKSESAPPSENASPVTPAPKPKREKSAPPVAVGTDEIEALLPKPNLDFSQAPPPTASARGGADARIRLLAAILAVGVIAGAGYQFGLFTKLMAKFQGTASPHNAPAEDSGAAHPSDARAAASMQPVTTKSDAPAAAGSSAAAPDANAKSSAQAETPNPSPDTASSAAKNDASREATLASEKTAVPAARTQKHAPILRDTVAEEVAAPDSSGGEFVGPKLVKSVRPVAPPEALRGFVTGNVKLDAQIDATGHVKSVNVLSGPQTLRAAAIDTVKQYKYAPAMKSGKPVESHAEVTVQFWYEP